MNDVVTTSEGELLNLAPSLPGGFSTQARLHEVFQELGYASYNAAGRGAGISPSQLYNAIHRNPPGTPLLERIAAAWGIRPVVFFLTREEAAPLLSRVPQQPSPRRRKNNKKK